MNKWIKINELLPDKYETVLVWVEEVNYCNAHVAFLDNDNNFKILDESDRYEFNVTHWQAMPITPNFI